jgi:chromosome partitioning protein
MKNSKKTHTILIANEKGGSGKSTTAMHLIVALLKRGHRVASIDLDVRQRSLTRYVENRRAYGSATGTDLPMPQHVTFAAQTGPGERRSREEFLASFARLSTLYDVIVIDTPGSSTLLTRAAHAMADTLITPINDSFVDLDVLARVEGWNDIDSKVLRVAGPTHYSEMVWEAKKQRATGGKRPMDWIVMRNRLSSLDARNKKRMELVLAELARRFDFRLVPGFGERVIYRELFLSGLTMIDLGEAEGGDPLTLSNVAARQEVRALVEALNMAPAIKLRAAG